MEVIATLAYFVIMGILLILLILPFFLKDKNKIITMKDIKDNWEKSGHDYPKKFDKYLEDSK